MKFRQTSSFSKINPEDLENNNLKNINISQALDTPGSELSTECVLLFNPQINLAGGPVTPFIAEKS